MIGWGIGLTVQGLTIFAGRSFFGREWEQKKVDEIMARENLKVVLSEKQLVQAQIEPHFLFNTLANVQTLLPRAPGKSKPDARQLHRVFTAKFNGQSRAGRHGETGD